ncbi:UDP-N-acetylglucosamine 1-carboxyvinyltransferase [Brevibacterium luteolum]|uniref:UDP-N-acetylglucosamine 1-carboxyvinyltransferase n=1 Tax=Brevibacterium luteolum TaxID=199591 RepID=UPI0021AE516D|nr:UDP-N-acetylglucosamine 1-carboxyvinyltransferase [Brevibacterium luteolum]MCT1830837.1 UDP-N-acetylglucosamine 1-carboxyvinyltransferase [Brevibacterium luteolum]
MEILSVNGPHRLTGDVTVRGAKNSILKLMAATLLAPGRSVISNVPRILDVSIMTELLRRLGCEIDYDPEAGVIDIDVPEEPGIQADYELVRAMRASICVLGPLTGRMRAAHVAMPGGDAIGSRGLDMHQAGLEAMGASAHLDHGYFIAEAPDGLTGAEIHLPFPSVGATENLLMAATLADGTTIIDNAAKEPEIIDICLMLQAMGAQISGIGTKTLTIEGVDRLHPVKHRVVGDRIVAGSWAFAAAITGGDITVRGIDPQLLPHVFEHLRAAGAEVSVLSGSADTEGLVAGIAAANEHGAQDMGFRVIGPQRPHSIRVATLPFPGFPTDLQPFAVALNAIADGVGLLTENLFEARWRFVHELARLGAEITIDGNHALVTGVDSLSGAEVEASDIRAGAALVIAGLAAEGRTEVSGVDHIDRGYEGFVEQLQSLGADVQRVDKPEPFDVDSLA